MEGEEGTRRTVDATAKEEVMESRLPLPSPLAPPFLLPLCHHLPSPHTLSTPSRPLPLLPASPAHHFVIFIYQSALKTPTLLFPIRVFPILSTFSVLPHLPQLPPTMPLLASLLPSPHLLFHHLFFASSRTLLPFSIYTFSTTFTSLLPPHVAPCQSPSSTLPYPPPLLPPPFPRTSSSASPPSTIYTYLFLRLSSLSRAHRPRNTRPSTDSTESQPLSPPAKPHVGRGGYK